MSPPDAEPAAARPPAAAADAPVDGHSRSLAPWMVAAGLGGLLLGLLLAWGWRAGQPVGVLLLALAGALALGWLVQRTRAAEQQAALRQAADAEHLRALERRARQLDAAEHLVSVGSFDWSPGSGELHWSEEHYRQWGFEPGSVTPSLEVFVAGLHPDDAERVQQSLQRALRGELRYDCRHRVLRADGSVLHVHGRGEVSFDALGQPLRMVGAVLDITERVQAESALRLQGFVLDALPDPVSAIDGKTHGYRLVNRAWLEANGLDRGQAIGLTFEAVFPVTVSPARREALIDCVTSDRTATVRGPSPSVNHQGRTIETRYIPFHDPQLSWRGAVMVSRDVSDDEGVRADLRTSVDKLSLTLNTIGDAIFATEAEGPEDPVLFANEQLLRMWEIPAALAPRLTARQIIDHARRWFVDPDAEVARIGVVIGGLGDVEDRLELNDGRVLLRRCKRTQLAGRQVRVWIFRDVTVEARAVRNLAAAEARQRTLLAAFPGYIWVVDAEHRVVFLNPAAAQVYLPWVPPPLAPAGRVFGETVYARLRPSVERALGGESLSLDWYRPSRSGRTPEHLLIRMAPGTDAAGQRLCYAFGVDISSLKQAEAALTAAKDEAERANRAKTQFLSSMSHELRTPLNAVIGFSQVLELNAEHNLKPRQLRQLGDIRRAGQHLLTLINDLLDMARIEAGRTELTLQPVGLAALADECLLLVQPTAPAGTQVRRSGSPPQAAVLADRTRLKQVLLNLLSNAVKYNRAGGQVELDWVAEPPGRWRLQVRDQGPGLDVEAQARLFTPFERLEAERSGVVGTGIGLALSRSLVTLMQGQIGVDSRPGEGSCFWVSLAAAPDLAQGDAVAAPPTPNAGEPQGPRQSTRLLYVDDNPINLALLEGLFEELPGWRLDTCDRSEAALQRLRHEACDLLLVDLQMPGMDGYQLFERLRSEPATRTLPMIAISADASPETSDRCLHMGFADFVPKPVEVDRLLDAVDRALGRQRAADWVRS